MSMVVSSEEAKALKRFRNNPDSRILKDVLLRELKLSRDQFESEPVSEDTRVRIHVFKTALRVLFDEELLKETV